MQHLLEAARRPSAEYGGRLANHLPMALIALARMGAPAARLDAFAAAYAARKVLRPLPAAGPALTAASWPAALGDTAAEGPARGYFRGALAQAGRDRVLRGHLPALLPGLGGSAFHALIRTAYAVECGDDAELAAALAYWTMSHLPLGEPAAGAAAEADPLRLLAELRAALDGRIGGVEGPTIFARMALAARLPGFAPVVDRLAVGVDGLPVLAAAAVALFAHTADFTALHMMTALHALRLLLPWVEDRPGALRQAWRALAAAYVAAAMPPLPTADALDVLRRRAAPGWPDILAAASASDDEHVVKAAYTAWQEDSVRADPLYRVAAARYAGLIA
ncbi:MAG TPA: questin oxidase family protein [Alphaproteobacteria bacterium]|nr:questin oxidase family protein [Alphaproteobacteria bacterium]